MKLKGAAASWRARVVAAAVSADDWESGLIGGRGLAGAGSGVGAAVAAGHAPEARRLLKRPEKAHHFDFRSHHGKVVPFTTSA